MKFGLFTYPSRPRWLPHVAAPQVFDEVVRQAELAEACGFDSFWVGEHHFDEYWATCPNPLTLLAHLAARTERLILGTSVILPALHNPIRLAEEIGLVDVLSHGRLIVGLGSGYLPFEFGGYGVTYDARRANAWEHIDQLLAALRSGSVSTADGKPLRVYPASSQQPHPPLLYCGYREESVRKAIRRGLYFMHPSSYSVAFLEQKMRRYHELVREEGLDPADFPHLTNRAGFVDLDSQRAADIGVTNRQRASDTHGRSVTGPATPEAKAILDAEAPLLQRAGRDPAQAVVLAGSVTTDLLPTFENLRDEIGLFGSPDDVIPKLERLREMGTHLVLFSINQQYLEPEYVATCMQLLGREVLPRFRDDGPLLLPNPQPARLAAA